MVIFVLSDRVLGDTVVEVARLRSLADDLEMVGAGGRPSREVLDNAPLLSSARVVWMPGPCLTGIVAGHPKLKGPTIVTSEVFMVAPDDGWARTRSRFYRIRDFRWLKDVNDPG